MSTYAIIVAAGSGTRAGGEVPKQYQIIGDQPVIAHTVQAFLNHPQIDGVTVVIGKDHGQYFQNALSGFDLPAPVFGGDTRQQSVFNGLQSIADINPDSVLIHDAARPFISAQVIDNVISALEQVECSIPAVEVVDTITQVEKNLITGKLNRSTLRAVQTPQGFNFNAIYTAHKTAADAGDTTATDDSALMSSVTVVQGDCANIKLTTASDITQANQIMSQNNFANLNDIRVGQGYDVHAFEDGDHVTLCGEKIPYTKTLKGHSDADVAMHALTDAILGAISEGDIGKHYPPSDPQWKGAASEIFLKGAVKLVEDRGGRLAHCDITIICEAPKLRPHIDAMRQTMGNIMGLELDRMSIKATTSEQLGFTGRGEGIAAMATATVRLP